MDNKPYKVIYCVKNDKQQHQYYHYIFLGNVPQSIKSIVNKFADLSLSDAVNNISIKEIEELNEYYGDKWFTYFFNKEHIDFSLSTSNPKFMSIVDRLKLKNPVEKEYYPQFTYGFNIHRVMINKIIKMNKFATHQQSGGEDNEQQEIQTDEVNEQNSEQINEQDEAEQDEAEQDEAEQDEAEQNLFDNDLMSIVNQAKEDDKIQVDEKHIESILIERSNEQLINEEEVLNEEENINLDSKEQRQMTNDVKQAEEIMTFKEIKFDESKNDNEYEENLYNSFNKYYVFDQYINTDDTIETIKRKISAIIKNRKIFESQNIIPSRMHLWIRWVINKELEANKKKLDVDKFSNMRYLINSSNRREEDIVLGNMWIDNNSLLKFNIKPHKNLSIYLNIGKEIKELDDKLNKAAFRIQRKSLDNNILSSYSDYLDNNDIFMIDVYNEINNIGKINETQMTNLTNTFFKLYFPDINPNDIPQILSFINNAYNKNKSIESGKELAKIEYDYNQNLIECSLSYKIENIYHEIKTRHKINIIQTNYINQIQFEVKLESDELLNFQRLELYKIFDNFELDDKFFFIQYTKFNNDTIFKFDEQIVEKLIKEKDMFANIAKWFNGGEYGLMFRVNYDDRYIPLNISLDVVGKLTIKFYWKEEDAMLFENVKNYFYIVDNLIDKINKIIESKIKKPNEQQFRILFITSLEKFKLSSNKEINHNELSNFSRLFYPYFSLVIEPKKRISKENKSNYSKYGTYLRYKRINDYENIKKIENRIKYFIKFVDLTPKEIINEMCKQYNLTVERATKYYDDVINKYPNIKRNVNKLKSLAEIGKDKMDGVEIGIQGKSVDNYKIRLNGVRNYQQVADINNVLSVLLFLYEEIYIKKTQAFKYLLDILNKIKNIAERRNFVSDFVQYADSVLEIKQMQQIDDTYVGYRSGKGIVKHSRICQNSGKDNRRRPIQLTDDSVEDLIKTGYKLNDATGMYEKQTTYNGKKITLRIVKLKTSDSNVYYTCDPVHNGRHTFIGFLTKGKTADGKYPPCCFRTDVFESNNKNKKNFNLNQIKQGNNEVVKTKELTFNELYYILADIIKVPDGRLATLPDSLDYFLNIANNRTIKIIQHILTTADNYYFKMGCGSETEYYSNKFISVIAKAINMTYDDIIATLIISLNSLNIFNTLNNGNIKFTYQTIEKYVEHLKTNTLPVKDLIELMCFPGVLSKEGYNIFVLDKTYSNKGFTWDIHFKYVNNENVYDAPKSIYVNEYDNNYYLIVRVNKNKTIKFEDQITKVFDKDDEINKFFSDFFNSSYSYLQNTAKDIARNNKVDYQCVDIVNKCNYVVINKLLVPVINSGPIPNIEIAELDKFIDNYSNTIKRIEERKDMKIRSLIYDKVEGKKYRIRGVGVNELVIPIKKEYITTSKYKLIYQPSYSKLDKLIQSKQVDLKKDSRIKLVNAFKYRNEAYELFRYNLSYYFKSDSEYKTKIINIIDSDANNEEKVKSVREALYQIINNEKANKFYYNKTKQKIISKNKPLIYVYNKIELDDYELDNNRFVSELKSKGQCTSKHDFYDNGRCMFSLSINMLVEFISRLAYELVGNQLKRFEVLRINGYKVSSIVNTEYFTNHKNEKMLKKKSGDVDNPFVNYYNKQIVDDKVVKKIIKPAKVSQTYNPFKLNGMNVQRVMESHKHIRAFINCLYYYRYSINLGYYNVIQDNMINNAIAYIINYLQENEVKDAYEMIIDLSNNSDSIDFKKLYSYLSKIYQLNIKVIDINERVIFETGKTSQLIILKDDNIVCNVFK